MNKEEIIDEYVKKISLKMDNMPSMFAKTTMSDKKHMENGFRYAMTESVNILREILAEEKKPNAFRNFIDKQLGLKAPTQEDIENEKAKIELEKQRLELAKIRSEKSELAKKGGGSSIGSFVQKGLAYNPLMNKKKKTDEETN